MDTRVRDREGALSEDEQLGVVLVKSGIITIDQLGQALGRAKERGVNLARVLIEDKLLTEEQFVGTLAEQLGLEFVDLATYPVDPAAAALVSENLARRYLAMPIGWWEGRLIVAMADPSNVFAIDDIRTLTGAEVRQVVVTAEAVTAAINKYYRKDSEAEHVSAEAAANSAPMDDDRDRLSNIKEVREDAPIVRLVNLLISQAITDHASDIHVEPTGKDVRIRYRIDGVLHEVMRSPRNIQNGMISRLKVMADINIAERRIPQDGRISTTIDRAARWTCASPPSRRSTVKRSSCGSSTRDQAELRLSDLGFLPANMRRYESSYTKPYGTMLVTGPTGSGKTTTLYATLNILNHPSKNVITVEDPVEYQLDGINQIQVNNKAGLTFASALRTILRADPDIILVGEIRDRETATIGIEAALDGPPRPVDLPHQRRRHHPEPAHRDGRRTVPGRQLAGLHRRPTAGPQAVRALQARFSPRPGQAGGNGLGLLGDRVARRDLPGRRLPGVRQDRLCRALCGARNPQRERGNRAHDR